MGGERWRQVAVCRGGQIRAHSRGPERRAPGSRLGAPSSESQTPSKKPHTPGSELQRWSPERQSPRSDARPCSKKQHVLLKKAASARQKESFSEFRAPRMEFGAPCVEVKGPIHCCKKQHARSKKPHGWGLEGGSRGFKPQAPSLRLRIRSACHAANAVLASVSSSLVALRVLYGDKLATKIGAPLCMS